MAKSVQAVERACDLLFLIASKRSGLGVSEIASELGLSKSAVHRLLVSLGSRHVIQQDSQTHRYLLHPRVLELALPFLDQTDIPAIARPFLERLRDQFQETTLLVLRSGFYCSPVTHSPSPHELRFTPTIGRRMALHWGAFGKAILAALPDDELDAFLHDTPLAAATPQTIVEPDRIREELRKIRERGYSTSSGEVIAGNAGLGACICDRRKRPLGCIGIGGPELRMRSLDLDEVGRELQEAARQISSILRLQNLEATDRET